MNLKRSIVLLVMVGVLLSLTTTALAQRRRAAPPPFATIGAKWTPNEQLVSVTGDTRTVNLQMAVTTDRQFWAMDISCLVSVANLFEGSSASQTMIWGPLWLQGNGAVGENHFDSTRDSDAGDAGIQYYDVTTNRINATITRVGTSNQPFGYNGTSYTESLFSLDLTIAEGLTGVIQASLICDKVSLLDRDGVSVGAGAVAAVANQNILILREGYTVRGSAARQSSVNQNEVVVRCTHDETGNIYEVQTETIITYGRRGVIVSMIVGQFGFENAFGSEVDPLRDFGLYECIYSSEIGGTEDTVYLRGRSFLNLQTPDYKLQPVTIPTGDTNGDNDISVADFTSITVNWQEQETPFTNGDVNGDGLVNEIDLIITAGNVGLSDASGGVMLDHVIYSAARDYNNTFPNNTLAMGSVFSGEVAPLSTLRAFWPQVSPDGSKLAFYTEGLVTIPAGRRRTITVLQKGLSISSMDAFGSQQLAAGPNFAPSWSPHGQQIAYICSWEGYRDGNANLPGYEYNNGNLCIINATGGTPRTIIPPGASSTFAEVFPPAWYDETTIVYGGNASHPICPDQLCYYDLLTNTHGRITNTAGDITVFGIDGTNVKANMPVIIRSSNGTAYLFYRRFTTSTSDLRMGTVDYKSPDGTAPSDWTSSGVLLNPASNPDFHEIVDNTSGGVHYYDVSPMLDVMFYEFGDYQFQNLYFEDTGAEFQWNLGEAHIVDGFIGYPTLNEDNNVWDGYDESFSGTDFHAFRASVDWLP